jgi:GNAT superfamily N-acetyltransferase
MVTVERHREFHLPELQQLINSHLGGVVPGWSLPASFIARSLQAADREARDPWVAEQATLCAVEERGLVGAAHLLRYGHGPEVSAGYRGAGEIAWLLFWPEAEGAGQALLSAAHELVDAWGASRLYACDTSLPVPVVSGVPESWPHVALALTRAGFAPVPSVEEVLYGGELTEGVPAGEAPVLGLEMRVVAGDGVHDFHAELEGVEIGSCRWVPDLSLGGALPALVGWAELGSLNVREGWRGRGIGTWLVRRTIPWLRLAGVSRVVVPVTAQDEAHGSSRFCRRLGWEALVRLERGWARAS